MDKRITVKISPQPYYITYADADFLLCEIEFIFEDHTTHRFISEISNKHIKNMIAEISAFLSGKLRIGTELYYPIPWIMGFVAYPYSFLVADNNTWKFRYKRHKDGERNDFLWNLNRDDLLSVKTQLETQFAEIKWDEVGKATLYRFEFAEKDYEWCYSAKSFCEFLHNLCAGKSIHRIFVSAENCRSPLSVKKNFINYLTDPEVIFQLDGLMIDFEVIAQGLFRWRIFHDSEYTLHGPSVKFIENGRYEFCEIGNVYGNFQEPYTDTPIQKVFVESTNYWPWARNGFDKTKLGEPVELPQTVRFGLQNGVELSLHGWDDDFVIALDP